MAELAVEKAKKKPKQALKKAEQEPERLAQRGSKKAKGMFEDLKDRTLGKSR